MHLTPDSPFFPAPSAVRVFASRRDWSTGFFYEPTHVVACAHGLRGISIGGRVDIVRSDLSRTHGFLRKFYPPEHSAGAAFPDVAIIEVPDAWGAPMRLRIGSYVDLTVAVGYYGFPERSPDGIFAGLRLAGMRAITGRINSWAYRIEGEVEAGASGSAIISDGGEVVAMLVSVQGSTNRGSATPMHLLIEEIPELRAVVELQAALEASASATVESIIAPAALQALSDPFTDAFVQTLRDRARAGHVVEALTQLEETIADAAFGERDDRIQAAYLRLAASFTLATSGDADAAQALLDRARPADPEAAVVIDAKIALARRDVDAALAMLADRYDADADLTRVAALYFERRTPQAVTAVTESRERHPDDREIMRMEALVLLAVGRQPESMDAARRALDANPGNALARWTLGVTLYHARVPRELTPPTIDGPPNPVPSDMLLSNVETAATSSEAVRHIQDALAVLDASADQRPMLQAWLVAALLLAGRTEEAAAEVRAAMSGPVPNDAVIPWVVRWNIPVDLSAWSTDVRHRIDEGAASVAEIQIFADLDIVRGDGSEAERVMSTARDLFVAQGAENVWRVTLARALARRSRFADALVALGDADERLAMAMRDSQSRRDGEDVREGALASYRESGDVIYLLEAVESALLAHDAPWAAQHVPELVERLQTRAATEAALAVLFNVNDYEAWERLYDDRLLVIDPDDPRVAQMRIGVFSRTGRLRDAADVAQRQLQVAPDTAAYYRLGYIYMQLADVEGLANTGRAYLQTGAEDVPIALQFAEWLVSSNVDLARRLFDSAMAREVPLAAVQTALLLAHAVGREDRTGPLMRRMPELVAAGIVRTGNVSDLRDLMSERRETVQTLNASYRQGAMPIHALADDQNFPVIQSHVVIAQANEQVVPAAWTPIFIRHATRGTIDGSVLAATDVLALELTTLLLLHSFGFSEVVEDRWPTIIVSRNLGALAREAVRSFQSGQPTHDAAAARVVAYLDAGRAGAYEVPADLGRLEQALWPYEEAERRDARVVDWGVFLDPTSGEPVVPVPTVVGTRGIDVWKLVEALRDAGELTVAQAQTALTSLGPNRPVGDSTVPTIRGAPVLLSQNVTEWLEEVGALRALFSCASVVELDTTQALRLRRGVQDAEQRRMSAETADAFARHCAERLADGGYRSGATLPGYEFDGHARVQARELFEFLGADVGATGALAVDDRFATQWPDRGGAPIVGFVELLDALRRDGSINDERYFAALIILRSQALFFVVVTSEEIVRHVRSAHVLDGALVETAELRILRRYLAYALAILHRDDDVAARSVEENSFAAASSSNIRAALAILFEAPDAETDVRAQWVLRNLWFDDVSAYSGLPAAMPGLRADAVADMAAALLFMDVLAGGPEAPNDEPNGAEDGP